MRLNDECGVKHQSNPRWQGNQKKSAWPDSNYCNGRVFVFVLPTAKFLLWRTGTERDS